LRPGVSVAVALVLFAFVGTASAGLQETFRRANEAYWSGDFQGATEGYEELIGLGVRDPDLFYNLGSAYARLDRYGPSIVNFERALRLAPGHVDARHNLGAVRRALARQRTRRGEDADLDPPRSFWLNLLGRVSQAQVGIPFLVCWVALFAVLAFRRSTRRELLRLVLLVLAPLLAAAALVLGTLFLSKAYYDANVQEAIIVASDRVTVREGPGERFGSAHSLREGDRVRVLDDERTWILVRDSEGREGWGSRDDFGLLRL
jgi:tetratricopeptide (TPR) repeat protein